MCVSEICVKQIRVNQGLVVHPFLIDPLAEIENLQSLNGFEEKKSNFQNTFLKSYTTVLCDK